MIGAMAISTSDTPGTVPGGKATKAGSAPATTTTRRTTLADNPDAEILAPGTTSNAPLSDAQSPIPRDDKGRIIPTPGDVRTEPVATAQESHVAGRVGPRTIAEDSAAVWVDGVEQIDPGRVLADTPEGPGPVPTDQTDDPQGEFLASLDDDRSDDARDRDSR